MQNKTLSLAAAVAAVGITTALVAGATYAGSNDLQDKAFRSFFVAHKPMHQAMETALESGDYQTWLAAAGESNPLVKYVTEENFAKFVELHQAMKDGDVEKAEQLHEELGLPARQLIKGKMKGLPLFNMMFRQPFAGGQADALKTAIEANDYNAFKTAVENMSPLKYVTADNFSEFSEAFSAMENKDMSKMQAFWQTYGPQANK